MDKSLEDELPNDFSRKFGVNLKAAREKKNISQEYLARAINKRRSSISELENGKMIPDIATLILLSRELECAFADLIPAEYYAENSSDLSDKEQELIVIFRKIKAVEFQDIAIVILQALVNHGK